jgi:hypothetical protein
MARHHEWSSIKLNKLNEKDMRFMKFENECLYSDYH